MTDLLTLYRWAVQDPETQVEVLRQMALAHGMEAPLVLREDFAGSAAESVAWVAYDPKLTKTEGPYRTALAVELHAPTVDWARTRARQLLGARSERVLFVVGDVLQVGPPQLPPAHITAALNFSVLYLREPEVLASYLRAARAGLQPGGLLVLNLFGGPEATTPGTTTSRASPRARLPREPTIPPFDVHWEVRSFDPATRRIECRLHFTVAGAPECHDAFVYDWRLWSPGELVTACREAGFTTVEIWRHTYSPEQGVFLGPVDEATLESLPRFTVYVVARV